MQKRHQVVILGGGFGGLRAAQTLRGAPLDVTLVDRRNFHLFQPLLYQVATGGLSPANIAAPLRGVLKKQNNARVLLGEAIGIDVAGRRVILRDGNVPYDTLIVATGSRHHYFGHPEWERFAPGLKTIEDATEIRRRILLAFEAAEREMDPRKERAWLTFVIVGAGPTGVELAGAVSEIAHDTLRREFRRIDPTGTCIILLEAADRVLPAYPPPLSAAATSSLKQLDVTVETGATVTSVSSDCVSLRVAGESRSIPARTVLWAAGVQASPLGRLLAEGAGAELDRAGRLLVEPDLSLPGHREILVVGDLANFSHQAVRPLPGVAPVAMQQGRYAARLIVARLRRQLLPSFKYRDRGSMATIGRAAAVVDLPWLRFSGFLAWLTWLFIHLLYIVEFQNRLLVLLQWAWNYFTFNRSARLITGDSPFPLDP
jgi:NADH:quinone reductase (non-electrogenic)